MKMRVELGPLGCFPPFFFKKYIVTVKIVFFNIEEYFQTQNLDNFFTDAVILEVYCVGV